jgi:CheY-like chemotaxis protein
MVVEDETVVAADIASSLESMGYEIVLVTGSAEDALERVPGLEPDLAIVDIKLEGEMDGIELAASLLKRHGIAVIFLTAYADQETLERAKFTEPYAYVMKPFERRELESAVYISLYRREAARRQRQAEAEKEKLIAQLREALERVRVLSDLLPICSSCRKIRDGAGAWQPLEDLVLSNPEVQATHSICPECASRLYPEMGDLLDTGPPKRGGRGGSSST